MSITGLMITGYATPHGARYLGLFLINMGASGSIPGIIAYVGIFFQVGNLIYITQTERQQRNDPHQGTARPSTLLGSLPNQTSLQRAVSTGVIVAFGGVGGVFATTVYRQQDFPRCVIWTSSA